MSALTIFLQRAFAEFCPPAWQCLPEQRFLSAEWERALGYAPRADVLLEGEEGQRRLFVEFEVSRADPVANHAKFATSHLFEPQRPGERPPPRRAANGAARHASWEGSCIVLAFFLAAG